MTRGDFEPAETMGHHIQAYDYVVVPVTDGRTESRTPDGAVTRSELGMGETYARPAGGTSRLLSFVEIEMKRG